MAIIDNIPIELPYYGLKWSTFYTNIHDKRIDLNIYKKNFTGLVLGTENDLALATENRYHMLSPGMLYFYQMAGTENDIYLATENGLRIAWCKNAIDKGKENGTWARILYSDIDMTASKSFADTNFFKNIIGSYFSLSFLSRTPTDFDELHQSTAWQYLFEYKIDGIIQGQGYLLPETFIREWGNFPQQIRMDAVDGLGLLGEIMFVDNEGEAFTGIERIKDILSFIFYKAGLRRYWYDGVKYIPQGVPETDVPRGFAYNTWVDVSLWEGKTCKEVLMDILESVDAHVFQQGEDFIIRHPDNSQPFFAWKWDWKGQELPWAYNSFTPPKVVLNTAGKYIGRSNMIIDKPAGKVSIIYAREAVEDMTRLLDDPSIVGQEVNPLWGGGSYDPEGNIIGEITRVITLSKWRGENWSQYHAAGFEFVWDIPAPLPLAGIIITVEISLRLSLSWAGGINGAMPEMDAEGLDMERRYALQPIRLIVDGELWDGEFWIPGQTFNGHAYTGKDWVVDRYSTKEQKLTLYFQLYECSNVVLHFCPTQAVWPPNPPAEPWIEVLSTQFFNYKMYAGLEKFTAPETDQVYTELITKDKPNHVEISKVLGNSFSKQMPGEIDWHLYSGFAYYLWKYVYQKMINGSLQGVTLWDTRDGEEGVDLAINLLSRYVAYHDFNKYRLSISYVYLQGATIDPMSILQENHLEQNFLISNMQYIPKLDEYRMELIGFELK